MSGVLLLDLFCCEGGAAMGYHRAGFDVLGVDIVPRPRYPFAFVQADALEALAGWNLERVAAVHASPPCHDHVRTFVAKNGTGVLLAQTRELLERSGLPWVIENVPGAPMRADYKLCGCMFGLPRLKRERWFETSWHGFELRAPCLHEEPSVTASGSGIPSHSWYYGKVDGFEYHRLLREPRSCSPSRPRTPSTSGGSCSTTWALSPHWPSKETGRGEVARPNWEYIRVDVLLPEHPKIEGLSDKAFRALIDLWCYCGRNRNDGIVTDRRWKAVPPKVRAELVAQDLVDPIDIGGGCVMHDFTGPAGHQRSRKEIEDASAARSEKASNAAKARWGPRPA